MFIFPRLAKSCRQLSHCGFSISGRGSSQPMPWRHISCNIVLPIRTYGERRPRGSHMETTVDNMPLHVPDWSFRVLLNLKLSSVLQWIPNARSIGVSVKVKSFVLTSIAHSDEGMLCRTAWLFDTNLWRWRPPLLHISLASCTNWTRLFSWYYSSTVSVLATPSST